MEYKKGICEGLCIYTCESDAENLKWVLTKSKELEYEYELMNCIKNGVSYDVYHYFFFSVVHAYFVPCSVSLWDFFTFLNFLI